MGPWTNISTSLRFCFLSCPVGDNSRTYLIGLLWGLNINVWKVFRTVSAMYYCSWLDMNDREVLISVLVDGSIWNKKHRRRSWLGRKTYDFSCIFFWLDVFELFSQVKMFSRRLHLAEETFWKADVDLGVVSISMWVPLGAADIDEIVHREHWSEREENEERGPGKSTMRRKNW